MTLIGYARCSTEAQDTTGQVAQLQQAGCRSVFTEKESGAKADRAKLRRALDALEEGDVLVVTKLDRLARSLRDLLNVLQTVGDRGAGFKVLDTPALDSTTYPTWPTRKLAALAGVSHTTIANLRKPKEEDPTYKALLAAWQKASEEAQTRFVEFYRIDLAEMLGKEAA
jgi:Resolvase, N terminal domain